MIRGRAVPESRAVQKLGAKRGSDGMESRHVCGCLARPGRFATRGVEEDIHEFIEQRQHQLERAVEPLRGHGVRIRSSVRWGETIIMKSRMR
jgi:hypothetical protein